MTDNLLFVGIDGFDLRLADYYAHPFWEEHRGDMTEVTIPKPEEIESGDIATASSPRLWSRIYTGCRPETNGILGFWEYTDENGDVHALDMDLEWIRRERCEKIVNYTHFLVPPLWEVILDQGSSVGLTSPWFSYPLTDEITDGIDEHGAWALADFPFPRDSSRLDDDYLYHPMAAEPPADFQEEVGAGARVSVLVQQDPGGFYDDLLKQDRDRYDHVLAMIDEYGTPEFTTLLTRSTDGAAHQFRKDEDIRDHYPSHLRDGEENLRRIYEENMTGVQRLWERGDFDHLVIGGDHQTGLSMTDSGPEFHGDDHEWPAKFVIHSSEFPAAREIEGRYEDIMPTILDLLDHPIPSHVEGSSLRVSADVQEGLEDLGYM